MKKILLILCCSCYITTTVCSQQLNKEASSLHYFQQKADYTIDVTLNDVNNTLDAFESINYTNNSPDTLQYIWFHLWPNAYKNDKTAFSEQMLLIGRTDFYFSDEEKRGYINRLDFKVNGNTATLEDHPQYIDIVKLILPTPLLPGQTIKITTPFHEKLPFNFSRGGYAGHTYQVTQWYPKPAVYDNKGWHAFPYLDQGEFYSEFGSFDVQITLPKKYIVAATGELQNKEELQFLKEKAKEAISGQLSALMIEPLKINSHNKIHSRTTATKNKLSQYAKNQKIVVIRPDSIYNKITGTTGTRTWRYFQNNIHDFAWFADKNFIILHDTIMLSPGRVIDAFSYFTPAGAGVWKSSIQFIKDAIRTRSNWLGAYPYNIVSAVEAKMGFDGGMEYPTITSIAPVSNEKILNNILEHEIGHNWNYGILGSNEREYPWMDEGINTYFDNRYEQIYYHGNSNEIKKGFIENRLPADELNLVYREQLSNKKDQPIETPSEKFSPINYEVMSYYKTALWMRKLENSIGQPLFDSCLHEYYNRWKFRHPYPEDFKKVMEDVSQKNVDTIFLLLSKKGPLEASQKKDIKVFPFFNFKKTSKHNYIFISPAIGYNYYDKLMVGGIIHNYTVPLPKFNFVLAPLYATGSKTFTGIGKIGYTISSYGFVRKTEISISGEKFTQNNYIDSTGTKNNLGFSKITPAIKIIFRNKNAVSLLTKSIQWKTYFIEETGLLFSADTINHLQIISYPKIKSYINQLQLRVENNRVLYPYSGILQAEQSTGFIRLAFEGNYFFNYAKGGGITARLFGGKFIYTGDKTITKQFETDRYHLNMSGANGYEDYTYSNYFAGRNEFQGFRSQQIMIRDGGFKVRTDLLNNKIAKTDDWLAALNLTTDFPNTIDPLQALPVKIPLKVFLDVGTYAEAWKKNPPTGKFIYDGGLQLSFFKNLFNIYIPLVYSKVYSDYFKSTITEKRFWKNISFSVDIQNFKFSKFFNQPEL